MIMTKKELIICLYGSTGDLAFRKLIPALSKLKNNSTLPENTLILALGRRDFNNDEYFDFIKENNPNIKLSKLKTITKYFQMQILDSNDYLKLKEEIEINSNENTRVIHYLAVSPNMVLDITNNISSQKVVEKNNLNHSIVFEKPFGEDYRSAHLINKKLLCNYHEKQIYRIDHYLGKDLIKAIIDLRFKTNLLESALRPKKLVSIDIAVKEEVGVLNRGAYYDQTGAVKDMFQSHILQMVSLITMNKPKKFNGDTIINEKVKALKNLSIQKDKIDFGQYVNYLSEENINNNSTTETALKVTLKVKNKFKKVPINILTGKKLGNKETYIKFNLKDGSSINLNIHPNKSITLSTKLLTESINIGYNFKNIDDEYALLFNAIINSKKENFVRSDEIEIAWKIADSILELKNELTIYNPDTF